MDDMTAFERLIANAATRAVGPPRPVDAMIVVRSAKAAPEGRWTPLDRWFPRRTSTRPEGGFSMFSALKFVAASAIVALFGGFLLAGVLTTPQDDEMAPAAMSASPASEVTSEPTEAPTTRARTDLLAGVALTVEEVEPGVYRVVDDGVRDLASVGKRDIVTGYDGGLRLLWEDGFLRLGSDESHQWPLAGYGDDAFEVAPDGTMWVIPCGSGTDYPSQCGDARRSTDGEVWTHQPCPAGSLDCQGFTIAPDGTAWATWRVDGSSSWGRWRVGHLGPTGWEPLDGDALSDDSFGIFRGYRRMWITDAGDVYGVDYENIYRYEDSGWVNYAPRSWELDDVGPDGTVWYGGDDGLARFTDGEWAAWSAAELPGIRFSEGFVSEHEIDVDYRGETRFQVAPDGSLWFSPWRTPDPVEARLVCDGLAHFDGQTLDRFLTGQCISSMGIAADGSVWVFADEETVWVLDADHSHWALDDDGQGRELYVITPGAVPEAVMAIEREAPITTTSDLLPGVTLTVESVEPGVYRVVDDGVRDVGRVRMVVVGDDESVWVDSAGDIYELGRPGEHPGLVSGEGFLTLAADGTWPDADSPRFLDPGETRAQQGAIPDGIASLPDPWWPADYITDSAVHPDGTIWQIAEQNDLPAHTRVQHLGTGTWTTYSIRDELLDLGWCGVCDGVLCPAADCEGGWQVEITSDGTVWVAVTPGSAPNGGLLRFDGGDWEIVRPLGDDQDHGVISLAADRDGGLWVEFGSGHLARFHGGAWEVSSNVRSGRRADLDEIGEFGADNDPWAGWGFDWYLDIASDGSMWVRGDDGGLGWVPGSGGDLYIITPEAVAAAE
jgi:hypothetical protein